MDLLWTLIIGLVVGALAKFIMPGKDPGGIIVTILIGIAGAFVARFLGQMLGIYQEGETAGFIAAVLGAMLLLFLYRAFTKRTPA
ncbi:MAG TPA: GlsB/YeaQ/YmgE family stress response membrane protein [Gemmatimonadales bacterium]|nr:GlsB/YeaQ/YmgE family stress response membrane protein [Gemmatimonadales bacterium]